MSYRRGMVNHVSYVAVWWDILQPTFKCLIIWRSTHDIMLREKNLGTIFYVQYDPSLLKKRKISLAVIKRPEVVQHIVISDGILGDLFSLLNFVWVFQIFYNKPVWLWLSPPPHHKCCKNVSPHCAWHQKRPQLFRICRQKRWFMLGFNLPIIIMCKWVLNSLAFTLYGEHGCCCQHRHMSSSTAHLLLRLGLADTDLFHFIL